MSIENLTGRNKEIAQEAFTRIREGIVNAALRGMDWIDTKAADAINGEDDE